MPLPVCSYRSLRRSPASSTCGGFGGSRRDVRGRRVLVSACAVCSAGQPSLALARSSCSLALRPCSTGREDAEQASCESFETDRSALL